jgi:hypothetical protein
MHQHATRHGDREAHEKSLFRSLLSHTLSATTDGPRRHNLVTESQRRTYIAFCYPFPFDTPSCLQKPQMEEPAKHESLTRSFCVSSARSVGVIIIAPTFMYTTRLAKRQRPAHDVPSRLVSRWLRQPTVPILACLGLPFRTDALPHPSPAQPSLA